MGNVTSWFYGFLMPEKKRILVVGLDAAGKTTILYKLKLGEVITTIPTIGFNVEVVEYKNINITTWDVGGEDKIRPLWRYYYENTSSIIFVIDSNDKYRIEEAKRELDKMLCEEEPQLAKIPILIFANKQDLPDSMNGSEVEEKLQMHRYSELRPWKVQPSCAVSGEGLYEGLDWLTSSPPLNSVRFSKAKSAMK